MTAFAHSLVQHNVSASSTTHNCTPGNGLIRTRAKFTHLISTYLSFAIFLVALQGEFVKHCQEMESLLWLECEQVQIHQQKANHLSKAFYKDTWAQSGNGKPTNHCNVSGLYCGIAGNVTLTDITYQRVPETGIASLLLKWPQSTGANGSE